VRSVQIAQGFIQRGFEKLEGGRLHHLSGQRGPLLSCAHGEKHHCASLQRAWLQHHASLQRAWLCLLDNLPVGTGRSHYVPHSHPFSSLEHPRTPSFP